MMQYSRKHSGFAMLEVLLAIVVMVMASAGGYMLFGSGSSQTQETQMTSELMQIASAYSNLSSANLTSSITSSSSQEDVTDLLYNSGQLATNYFSGSSGSYALQSPYGAITVSDPSPVGFTLKFTFGSDKTSEQAQALYNSIQNSYDCVSGCDGSTSGDTAYSGSVTVSLDLST